MWRILTTHRTPLRHTLNNTVHREVKRSVKSLPDYLVAGWRGGYNVVLGGKTHILPRQNFPFQYYGGSIGNQKETLQAFVESKGKGAAGAKPWCIVHCSHEPHGPHQRDGDNKFFTQKDMTDLGVVLPPKYV